MVMEDVSVLLLTLGITVRHASKVSKPNKHKFTMLKMESRILCVKSMVKEWIERHVIIMVILSTLKLNHGRMLLADAMRNTLVNIVIIVRTLSWLTQIVLKALVVLFMILSRFMSS
jgi:hypothetical protein